MYLTQGLHRSVQRQPDKVAVIHGERQTTYRTLYDRACRLAAVFTGLGMNTGDRAAILAHNSTEYVEFILASWISGIIPVPLNTRWSKKEIRAALDDCGASALYVDDSFLDFAAGRELDTPSLRHIVHMGTKETPDGLKNHETLLRSTAPAADKRLGGDHLAVILYTSGTTGQPKGVMLSHGNFGAAALARMAEVPSPSEGIQLNATPMFHVAGLGRLVQTVITGASCVILRQFRPEDVLDAVARHKITDLLLVPSMIQMLLDCPAFSPTAVSSVTRIVYGASPIPAPLLDRAVAAMPKVEFLHTYGMTETAATVTINPGFNHGPEGLRTGRIRSAGRCGYATEVKIVDPAGNEVPRGTVGEIIVRGPLVMQGYWNRPEETDATLRDGWLYTGDGAWMDESGYLFVVERLKDMIITGGENVYSAEVENALSTHPAVAMCAVIGVPHPTWGEAVHAIVVLRDGRAVAGTELSDHCRQTLAGYKCPKSIEIKDFIPISATGKILKTVLRKPFWDATA